MVGIITGIILLIAAFAMRKMVRWQRWFVGAVGGFVFVVGLGLAGSSSSAHPTASPSPKAKAVSHKVTPKSSAKVSHAPHIGQWVTAGKLAFRVNSAQYETVLPQAAYGAPSANGGVWLVVNVSVKNGDTQARTLDTSMFTLRNGSTKYQASGTADIYINNNNAFFLESVNPGLTATGNIAFDVPVQTAYQLQVASGLFASQTRDITLAQ